MNQTHASRLLTLAFFLKTQVPPKHFDMRSYFSADEADDTSNDPSEMLMEGACGTTACALGWCPIIFPKYWVNPICPKLIIEQRIAHPFDDIDLFFGTTYDERTMIFFPEYSNGKLKNRTPKAVAKTIEEIVAKHGYTYAD